MTFAVGNGFFADAKFTVFIFVVMKYLLASPCYIFCNVQSCRTYFYHVAPRFGFLISRLFQCPYFCDFLLSLRRYLVLHRYGLIYETLVSALWRHQYPPSFGRLSEVVVVNHRRNERQQIHGLFEIETKHGSYSPW